jgi:hypothetical protein
MVFPYREITKQDALDDYEKLRNHTFKNLGFALVGNKTTDYYFQKYRTKAVYGNKISHEAAWANPESRKKIIEYAKKWKDDTPSGYRSAMRFLYGSINQFKPSNAMVVYNKFKPKHILDFSSGWGGRCLAAMALDIDYTGIDSNMSLHRPYQQMLNDLPTSANIKIIFDRAENIDYSKIPPYDLVFTSPPYEMLEKYYGMKDYGNRFYEEFFLPVIRRIYANLQPSGIIALNMPKVMMDHLKPQINGPIHTIKMPIHNRFVHTQKKNFELIYWFQKP